MSFGYYFQACPLWCSFWQNYLVLIFYFFFMVYFVGNVANSTCATRNIGHIGYFSTIITDFFSFSVVLRYYHVVDKTTVTILVVDNCCYWDSLLPHIDSDCCHGLYFLFSYPGIYQCYLLSLVGIHHISVAWWTWSVYSSINVSLWLSMEWNAPWYEVYGMLKNWCMAKFALTY